MRVIVGLCLLGVVCLVPAVAESKTPKPPKVDLTDYLDADPQVGDFRTYLRDDGPERTSTVYGATELKKSTVFGNRIVEDGDDVGAGITELVHGKEERLGSLFYPSGLSFVISRPKRILPFQLAPGVAVKFKVGFKAVIDHHKVGSATLAGDTTFVGFESVTTHLGTFDQTAHFLRHETLTLKGADVPTHIDSVSDTWISLELGTVLSHVEQQVFRDGVLDSTFGPHDYELDRGMYQGAPFGNPPPPGSP